MEGTEDRHRRDRGGTLKGQRWYTEVTQKGQEGTKRRVHRRDTEGTEEEHRGDRGGTLK
jgi:hypothetical protein